MKNLTHDAERKLNQYLRSMRSCLSGSPSVDVAEVEADVREHVERELEGAREPVGWTRMQSVLDRLGNPIQWVREDEMDWKRKALLRLRHGPEDWRLSYWSFGAAALAVWCLSESAFVPAAVAMVVAFLSARAAVSAHAETGDDPGAQLWLLGPGLVGVYLLSAAALMFGPALAMCEMADQILRLESIKPRFPDRVVDVAIRLRAVHMGTHDLSQTGVDLLNAGPWIPAALGAWWVTLGLAVRLAFAPLTWAFKPFLNRSNRAAGWSLVALGALSFAAAFFLALVKHADFRGF